MVEQRVVRELRDIVGAENVSDDKAVTHAYDSIGLNVVSRPSNPKPDVVVMPNTTQEVKKIVELANREKLPVYPRGYNLTGLATPWKNGLLMDFSNMKKVLAVNEEDMFMVVEPGVSAPQAYTYMRKHHPNYEPAISMGGPCNMVGNYLTVGGTQFGPKGFGAKLVMSLLAVMGTGEIVNTSGPGILYCSYGQLGIVTRMTFKIFPRPEYRKSIMCIWETPEDMVKLGISLADVEESKMLSTTEARHGTNWGFQMIRGHPDSMPKGYHQKVLPLERPKDVFWEGAFYQSFGGPQDKVLDEIKEYDKVIGDEQKKGVGVRLADPDEHELLKSEFENWSQVPMKYGWKYFTAGHREGAGITYPILSYPLSQFAVGYRLQKKIGTKYGFAHATTCMPPQGGGLRYVGTRFCLPYNQSDEESIRHMQTCWREMVREIRKIPGSSEYELHAAGRLFYVEPYRMRLKKAFDPNNIMSPQLQPYDEPLLLMGSGLEYTPYKALEEAAHLH